MERPRKLHPRAIGRNFVGRGSGHQLFSLSGIGRAEGNPTGFREEPEKVHEFQFASAILLRWMGSKASLGSN
jgi:hypothetical protein